MAEVTFQRVELPDSAFRRESIRSDQFFAEFDVKVDVPGCYAIDVKLVQDKFAIPNINIAVDDSANSKKCYCFDDSRTQKFSVTTSNPPIPDSGKTAFPPTGTALDPIRGKWPEDDGIFDDTLQLFVQVTVYSCEAACDTTKKCEPISRRKLKRKPVALGKTDTHDTDVEDGVGVDKGIGQIEKAVSAGASAGSSFIPKGGGKMKSFRSVLPTLPNELRLLLIERRLEELEGRRE